MPRPPRPGCSTDEWALLRGAAPGTGRNVSRQAPATFAWLGERLDISWEHTAAELLEELLRLEQRTESRAQHPYLRMAARVLRYSPTKFLIELLQPRSQAMARAKPPVLSRLLVERIELYRSLLMHVSPEGKHAGWDLEQLTFSAVEDAISTVRRKIGALNAPSSPQES